jgi:4-carboxymuconolactone decarboxylase
VSTTPRLESGHMFASTPELSAAFRGLYGRLWRHGLLDVRTKELIRLRNARMTSCNF